MSRQLIDDRIEELRRLGYARDLKLLFADGYCRLDWAIASDFGDDAHVVVREIFDLAHDAAHAERELESRSRPN